MDYKHAEETLEKGEQELPAPYGKHGCGKIGINPGVRSCRIIGDGSN
jgi:hypothetical protein